MKAAIISQAHQPGSKGDGPPQLPLRRLSRPRDADVTTAGETDVEHHRRGKVTADDTDRGFSKYDTCTEGLLRMYLGVDGQLHQRKRKTRFQRRSASRGASPTGSTASGETRQLFSMFQECMRTTLATVLENHPAVTTAEQSLKGEKRTQPPQVPQ